MSAHYFQNEMLTVTRGCFTPKMIENMSESIKGEEGEGLNYEMLDGWEDLPKEHQEKVIQALSVGHIEDDEWRGVSTMNRNSWMGVSMEHYCKGGGHGRRELELTHCRILNATARVPKGCA